jgi:hypothetical protein
MEPMSKTFALVSLSLLLPLTSQARPALRGAALAAVAIPETGDQPHATVRSLHTLLQAELGKHGIKVKGRLVPRRVSIRRRGLAAYARAHRLKRVYELRLLPVGEKLVVMLDEKRGRRMRSTFSAKLSASSAEELDAVVPCLVEAVVTRRQPSPPTPPQPAKAKVADAAPAAGEAASSSSAVVPVASVAAQGTPRQTEWLWGFSLHPGSFLRSFAGLYGGSAELYYDTAPWRFGAEAGGMGGSGRVLTVSGRAHYRFLTSEKLSPMIGAGLGFMMLENDEGASGNGVSFSMTGGAQLGYLKAAKLVAQAEIILPLFSAKRHDPESDNGIIDIVQHSKWSPAVVLKLSCLF